MKKFMLPLLIGAALCVGANASEFASPDLLQHPAARPSNNSSPVYTGRLRFEESPMRPTEAPGPIDFSVDSPFNPLAEAAGYSGILMPLPGLPAGSSPEALSPVGAAVGLVSPAFPRMLLARASSLEGHRSPGDHVDILLSRALFSAAAAPVANPDHHPIGLGLPANLLQFIAANPLGGDAGAAAGVDKRRRTESVSTLEDGEGDFDPRRNLRLDFWDGSQPELGTSSDDASSVTSGTESTSVMAGSESDSAAAGLSVLSASPISPAFHPGAAPKSKSKKIKESYVINPTSKQQIIALTKKVIARNGYKIVKK
jgi:hypothetical protein